jgi:hypothetical protein
MPAWDELRPSRGSEIRSRAELLLYAGPTHQPRIRREAALSRRATGRRPLGASRESDSVRRATVGGHRAAALVGASVGRASAPRSCGRAAWRCRLCDVEGGCDRARRADGDSIDAQGGAIGLAGRLPAGRPAVGSLQGGHLFEPARPARGPQATTDRWTVDLGSPAAPKSPRPGARGIKIPVEGSHSANRADAPLRRRKVPCSAGGHRLAAGRLGCGPCAARPALAQSACAAPAAR